MAPTDPPIPSDGSPALTAVVDRAKQLAGFLTASGFAAFVYGAGYIAVNRAGETFGIPDRAIGQGPYVRGGYLFFLQTAALMIEVLIRHAVWIVPVVIVAIAAFRLLKYLQRKTPRQAALLGIIVVLYGAGAVLAANGATQVLLTLQAENLWFREVTPAMTQFSAEAKQAVAAIARNQWSELREMYADAASKLALGMLCCLVGLIVESRRGWTEREHVLSYAKWLTVSSIAMQLLLMPSLYGVCYLVPKLGCVKVELESPLAEQFDNKPYLPVGVLLSDVQAEPIQLVIMRPKLGPTLYDFSRETLKSIAMLPTCNLLPGFPPAAPAGEKKE